MCAVQSKFYSGDDPDRSLDWMLFQLGFCNPKVALMKKRKL